MIRQHAYASHGFTAVELLITLFVAAAFLVAGYQLFNVVITDGGNTRIEASASNIAYDYLRRYSNSATSPCTTSNPITEEGIWIDGAVNAEVSVSITCPQSATTTLSKVEVIVQYGEGSDVRTVKYATFVDKSKGTSAFILDKHLAGRESIYA